MLLDASDCGPRASRVDDWLVAPVRVEGRTVAILRVLHPASGEEELRRADFLVGLAGAALTNASLLRQKAETRSLEQDSGRRLQALLDTAGVGLAVLDEGARITQANRWLRRALSQGRSLAGRSLDELVLARDVRRLPQLMERGEAELRFMRRDQTLLWTRCTMTWLGSRTVLSVTDITHRRLEELARFLEDERRLLSSELHDALARDLAAVHVLLQNPSVDSSQVLATVRRLRAEAERLAGVGAVGSPEALHELVARFSRDTGLEVEAELYEPSGLPGVFCRRIVQEALTNVRRHARALRVRVRVLRLAGGLEGSIEDDGRGFDLAQFEPASSRHFGLRGFRLRAELLGGSAEVRSAPGQGTEVRFFLPVT